MVDGRLTRSGGRDGGSDWATASVAKARAELASVSGAQRFAVAGRLAAVLVASARDEDAEAVLAEERREAARSRDPESLARVELASAMAALARDDDARASMHLKSALRALPERPVAIAASAWIIDARLARVQGRAAAPLPFDPAELDASQTPEGVELAAELALERAAIARDTQEWTAASEHLTAARALVERTSSPRLTGMFELEAGHFAAEAGDFQQGSERMRSSIDVFATAGLRRDEGRAIIRYAELVAANTARTGESAPALLGRAQTVLGAAATWRDRLWIRTGFRNFGRRVIDRVMTEGTVTRIEAFERARGALLSALSVSAEASERGLTDIELVAGSSGPLAAQVERARVGGATGLSQTAQAIGEVDAAVRDLIDLIGAALVERDRLRVLISVLQEIDAVTEVAALPSLATRLAARVLEADHVVLAISHDDVLVEVGRFGEPLAGAADGWRDAAAAATRDASGRPRSDASQLAARAEQALCGPVLAVAFRSATVGGALYADKLRRAGQFRDQDYAIAHLLADYVALALGRLRAREQEQVALQQLAVTLDAIRDGVIACDERGVVTQMNAAAARMLRVAHDELVGSQLARVALLAPLNELVSSSARVDGVVVRLGQGSFVVTARPIDAARAAPSDFSKTYDGEGTGGFVATLVELDRAQKIAQRITATRARYGFNDIVGTSPALQAAVSMARRAATIDANVLITGESGTGKEVIAQAIHSSGPRASEPFVGINVAALPRELLEAELFGYEKGAFTGARAEGNPGKFELAGEGTILLDEIGDMPLDMQAKMLRVLQERVVTRLGGRSEIPMRARVIATTHRNLEQLVDEGKFRMDLLYRLRVLAIEVPPLRDRPEDIALLAQHHLLRFAEQQRKRVRELGPRVLDELDRYDWPGNVRELANVMEAEVSLAAPDVELLDRLATRLVGRFRVPGAASTGEWRALPPLPQDEPILPLAEVEKKAFLHALEKMNGSVSRASEALGVSKVTFYAKLRSWGMHPRDEGGPASAKWSTRMKVSERASELPPSSQSEAPPSVRGPKGRL